MPGWTATSTVIVNAMRSLGFGYKSWNAISKAVMELLCIQFVDDTDLIQSGHDNNSSGPTIVAEMQEVLDNWDGLLRATGGALEHSKSYWYLLDYHRRGGKWCYKPPSAVPGDVSLYNDTTHQKEIIPRLPVTTAKKALGIFTRPDGIMHQQRKYLRGKASDWSDAMRTNHIRKDDAWYCLNTTIMKVVEYPLVATTLTRRDCGTIMAPTGLHSVDVQKNLPRALVYAPLRYQGMGIADPWATQLIEHLHVILRHCTRPTINGRLLNSNMENLTLELGSAIPF